MKRYLSIAILIMLVSLSGADPKKLEQQVRSNFGGVKLNQVVDLSGSAISVNIKDNSF